MNVQMVWMVIFLEITLTVNYQMQPSLVLFLLLARITDMRHGVCGGSVVDQGDRASTGGESGSTL